MKTLHSIVAARSVRQIHAHGAIACAVIVAVTSAIVIPALSRRSERLALGAAVKAAESQLDRTRAQVEEFRRETGRIVTTLNAPGADPAIATIDRRLLDISSIAGECGLMVDAVEPATSAKGADGTMKSGVTVSGRGAYPRVATYLSRLREAAPDLTVETAQFSAAAEGGCLFHLTLNWWNPPAKASPQSVAGGELP